MPKATKFLAVAADESATIPERARAAEKAASLLREITSFLLPPTAVHALEAQIRVQLPTPHPVSVHSNLR